MAVLDEFLTSLSSFLRAQDARQLQLFLRVEPPLPDQFEQLKKELKSSYRNGDALEAQIERLIPENEPGLPGPWAGFLSFIKLYLEYWRDVDFGDLLGTFTRLSAVTSACITAFSSPPGLVMLPTTIQLAETLTRLAMMLEKKPHLMTQFAKGNASGGEEGRGKKSLVETIAETIQRGFTICLTERGESSTGIKDGRPEGKKVGIYSFANLVLKLLFQCQKTQLASQLFTNISQQSPPLYLYSASQRVTYLYYLGRFQLYNTHFFSAQLALQAAYDQCHRQCINQRKNILIYLITANLILGRFPGPSLLSRPEAADVVGRFVPICKAMRKGDIIAFRQALSPDSANYHWFFKRNIYLLIVSRCQVIVWRSLARRTFLLTYQVPTDANSRKAPTLDLDDLLAAAQYCQKILEGWTHPVNPLYQGQPQIHNGSGNLSDLQPPPGGKKKLGPFDGVLYRNKMPTLMFVEATVASLVHQGLLHGFISHNQGKFAIIGAKAKGGPFNAGFPPVWEVIKSRAEREGRLNEVPGWIKEEKKIGGGGIVRMSHANPVG